MSTPFCVSLRACELASASLRLACAPLRIMRIYIQLLGLVLVLVLASLRVLAPKWCECLRVCANVRQLAFKLTVLIVADSGVYVNSFGAFYVCFLHFRGVFRVQGAKTEQKPNTHAQHTQYGSQYGSQK